MCARDRLQDPDDLFADTRMSFGDHIEELRTRLVRALLGFAITFMISFLPWVGRPVLNFITAPVEAQLAYFYDRRVEAVAQKLEARDLRTMEANKPKNLRMDFNTEELAKAFGI